MKNEYDVLIIGGGPGGLSAASYAARAGLTVAILEGMAPGGQILTIDNVENYPGFDESISGFELSDKFEKSATNFGAELVYTTATAITKEKDLFTVDTEDGKYFSKTVIYSTGAKHRHLDIPGEDKYQGKGVSYCATCDGSFFKNKKILVSGGGDSALQEALYLAKLSDDVTIVHRRDRFRAQAGLVQIVENEKNIKTIMNSSIIEILGDDTKVTGVKLKDTINGNVSTFDCLGVFIFIGSNPNSSLLNNLKVKLDKSGYVITDNTMKSSLDGLFAVGDVRDTPFRQIVTAAGDGAIAAHYAQQYIDALKGQSYGTYKQK